MRKMLYSLSIYHYEFFWCDFPVYLVLRMDCTTKDWAYVSFHLISHVEHANPSLGRRNGSKMADAAQCRIPLIANINVHDNVCNARVASSDNGSCVEAVSISPQFTVVLRTPCQTMAIPVSHPSSMAPYLTIIASLIAMQQQQRQTGPLSLWTSSNPSSAGDRMLPRTSPPARPAAQRRRITPTTPLSTSLPSSSFSPSAQPRAPSL